MAVGPVPAAHNVVLTTLHFDQPSSYDSYLKSGGYQALRKILSEKIPQETVIEQVKASASWGTNLAPSVSEPDRKSVV